MDNVSGWAVAISAVATVFAALGGYWLAGRNEEARDERMANRERAARQEEKRDRLQEQRDAFQRDTLLELQDQLQRLVRSTMVILMQDLSTLKEKRRLFQLPEGLSDENFAVTVAVQRLRERVLDEPTRAAIEEFVAYCAGCSVTLPAQRASSTDADEMIAHTERAQAELGGRYLALLEGFGGLLRRQLARGLTHDG
jgi:hypothetical protein